MKNKNFASYVALIIALAAGCKKNSADPSTNLPPAKHTMLNYAYASAGADSPFVHLDSANKMLSSYLNSLSISDPEPDLHSLIIDANALRYYLENQNITQLKIMFAHQLDYINNGGLNEYAGLRSDAITIVIAGINENSDYVYTPAVTALDNAKPCPYNCPNGGTAASDLLIQ